MADAIVSFGVQKLWELVSQEYELLEGVDDQITELKSDLNMLMSFLKDADAKKQTSALARNCVEEIKEITCDAEDIIETFLLKEVRRDGWGLKNDMKSLVCISGGRRDIALEITGISKRISKVIHVMQTFGIQPIIIDGGYSQALQERNRQTRHTFSSESESNLVGLEKNVEKLVGELVKKESSQVVSITGLGGLGKTTLARQVFNDDKIKHHFDGLVWVCVSQEFTRKYVWQTIFRNLNPQDKDSDMTEDELQQKLVQLLETKKALIVFDDIWTKNDWDTIKPMFPESTAGWKVLLTSRNDAIHPQCMTFKPEVLTPEECWTLLERIAFPKSVTTGGYIADKEMVKTAKEMIKYCGGLPLAIKVLGGLLAMQHTLHEWKRIYRNIISHIMGGISFNDYESHSVYHVLSLSFEGLPVYLKHCLLHLASFPEDYKIDLEKLSYYWAAEGISKHWHYDGATIRDVADVYMEELVKRNMVISERDIKTSRFETCHLHDVMREICLLKAKEENFLQIVTPQTSSSTGNEHSRASNKSRRLVVHCSNTFHGKKEIMNPKLRSLLFIDAFNTYGQKDLTLCLTRLQMLRILDLSGATFKGKKFPSGIGKLIHLRYLSLYRALISHLPSYLENLKLLLHLNLCVYDGSPVYVPNVFKEMQELRHLCLPKRTHGKKKLELGNLVKLETLENFSTKNSSVKDLKGMTKLTTLCILYDGGECTLGALTSLLAELRLLENLTLYDHRKIDRMGDTEEFVLDCIHLNKLDLSIHMPRLREVQYLPSYLTTIALAECCLEEDPLPILEKLLHLKEVFLRKRSFCGRRMICSRGGFPQLRELLFFHLEEWEEWIVEEGSMPLLHTLTIGHFDKLKEIPDGLRFITSLKHLKIFRTKKQFKEKLYEGGEDYYKVKHIPSVQICYQFEY